MEENQRQLVSDAIDYKGNPADRTASGGWVTATLILVELSERLSTMAIVLNLVTYLVGTMHLSSSTSSNISTNLAGTSYMLCLLGGILADTFLTRFRTIAIFAVVNAMGTCLLAVSTGLPKLRPPPCNPAQSNECVEANSLQMGVYTFALYLHGIGLGGIKSSVSGFGTDQFDKNDEKENLQMTTFFNVFYLIINIGTLLAVTVLVYIQDKVGRSWVDCKGPVLESSVTISTTVPLVQEVSSRSVAPSTRSPALSSPIGSSLAGLHGAHEPSPLTGDTVGSSPASFNDAPSASRVPNHILAGTNTHPMVTRAKAGIFKPKSMSVEVMEPSTIVEAFSTAEWRAATEAEYDALIRNSIWELVPLPPDRKVIGCKWLFKSKRNLGGTIARRKARLVAKGCSQVPGRDCLAAVSAAKRSVAVVQMSHADLASVNEDKSGALIVERSHEVKSQSYCLKTGANGFRAKDPSKVWINRGGRAASFNVFMIGSIMLTLAIHNRLIMPLFRKTRYSHGLKSLQKIWLGLLFSIIAMVGAALAERKRLSVAKTSSRTTALILPVTGFLLLPQFILVGIGDAFIYAGQLDFFITESPRGMKAIGTGLFLATISLGLFLSTILVEMVREVPGTNDGHYWLAHRINDGRLDLFYGLLAVLSLINLGLFLLCAKCICQILKEETSYHS
ncbi:protein NRT1/ PTR FAMILY 6.2-like [Gossypium hirsutum]|uniref:Protein NRT1/ PTR FAMILY 6.2-like n=1 Tax=Gossypium hirsutum TaxID=3635 RepID=A0A1U8PYH0_GOSHI|nr:protein NRT1/ PTR FAMILY 6.2-like [Gossypium hirsutum]